VPLFLNIHHQALLKKIEQELLRAREAEKSELVRQHLYSIKTLCELALDTAGDVKSLELEQPVSMTVNNPIQQSLQVNQASIPVTVTKQEKLETDDGANGESIFDF